MARVFISHSSLDETQAEDMKAWLEAQGFEQIFLDFDHQTGIGVGADWERTLYREIERCQALIIVLTPNWLKSKWCFAEFTQARALGKPIFPVIATPSGDTVIAPDIQHLDLTKDREGGLERLAASLTDIALNAQGQFDWDAGRPPYPGLLAFEEDDAAIYFGRDDDIRALIERLNARRVQGGRKLIAVLGASGSGKSSLLRAGVLPRLKRDRANWIVVPPFRPQSAPVDELARALSIALEKPDTWRNIREQLGDGRFAATAADLTHDLRVAHNALNAHILITIDQAEELFSTVGEAERQAFLEGLDTVLSGDLPVIVVAGLRSDYLGSLQTEETLTAPFEEFSLKPMPLERVQDVIRGPARVAGLRVDDALVARATADAQTEDALPLLAFALRELYDRFGGDGDLTLNEYRALGDASIDLTPLENAVRKAADDVLETAQPSAQELQALKDAFVPALVRVNSEGEFVRRPAPLESLPEAARGLLERLVKARLLVLRQEGDAAIVEVAHEALLRKWPRLAGWLNEEREFLIGKHQLERDTADWDNAGTVEKPAALLSGLKLSRAQAWLSERPQKLSTLERSFIEKSASAAYAQEVRQRRTRQFVTWGSAAVIAVLGAVGWWAQGVYKERQEIAREAARTDIRGEIIAYATAKGEAALDTMEGTNRSPYTTALVDALKDPSHGVLSALTAINQRVLENSGGRQRPYIATSMNGEIYLWNQPANRKKRALVISADHTGVNQNSLVAPSNDADAFAGILSKAGFRPDEIIRLHNPDRKELLAKLKQQLETLAQAVESPISTVADISVPGERPDRPYARLIHEAGVILAPDKPKDKSKAVPEPARPEPETNQQTPSEKGLTRIDAGENTLFIFYYAGLGAAVCNSEYIGLPSDRAINSADDLFATSVSIAEVSKAIGRRAIASIMILDTNFSNPFFGTEASCR